MHLEAFALKGEGRRVALRSLLPLVDTDSKRAWVQFAYEGEWEGHHAGSFRFTHSTFRKLLANFKRSKNPIPLTYEHPSYGADGSPIPAAGWIHDLKIRGDELWGLVEFTPRATQFVRDGEYRFCSVVVDFNSTDRKSGDAVGPELLEVGLTNVPFLDGMQPIRFSRRIAAADTPGDAMNDVDLIKAAIKELGDEATLEKIAEWVKAKRTLDAIASGEDAPAEDAPEGEPAPMNDAPPADAVAANDAPPVEAVELMDPAAEAAGVDFAAAMGAIAEAAGLDEASMMALLQERAEDIGAYFAQLAAGQPDGTAAEAEAQAAMSARKLSVAESQISKLSRKVDELTAKLSARDQAEAEAKEAAAQAEAEAYVDGLIESGSVLDSERADFVRLAREDREFLDRTIGNRTVVPLGKRVNSKPPEDAEDGITDAKIRSLPDYRAYERALRNTHPDPAKRHTLIVSKLSARGLISGRA